MTRIIENIPTAFFYWCVASISIFVAYVYQNCSNRKGYIKKNIFGFFIIILPAVFIGSRQSIVGVDTINYWRGYLDIDNVIESQGFFNAAKTEILFFIIKFLCHLIWIDNPTPFLTINSFITLLFLFLSLDKLKDRASMPFSFFIYYSFLGMQMLNQMRQLVAVTIVLYAVTYLLERRRGMAVFWIIIASLYHFTALVSFSFIFIIDIMDKKEHFKGIKEKFLLTLILVSPFFISLMMKIASSFLPSKYDVYLKTANSSFSGSGLGFLVQVLPVIIPLIFFHQYIKDKRIRALIVCLCLAIPCRIAGYYSYFLMRLMYYPIVLICVIFSIIRNETKGKIKFVFSTFIMIVCCGYYIVNYMYINGEIMFPYISVINF
ncbi:MAG: EpsG family protein [Lachnospiraceae bacterium]|jgi:transmembrane protein EpsG|nr:EpsG family protein [Lachnospiraceae bacterium]